MGKSDKPEAEIQVYEVTPTLPKPPDGGYGWVIVAACFSANMIIDGFAYTFGIFINEFGSYFNSSKGTTAAAGALLNGIYMLAGPVSAGLSNRFGNRIVMMVGGVISSVAFFTCVWAPSIIHFLILYGVVGGIGFAFIYLPAVVSPGFYFEQKRAIATGIAVSGSGFGTVVFAPLTSYLLKTYGWQGAHWILAGLMLNVVVCGALLRSLPKPAGKQSVQVNSDAPPVSDQELKLVMPEMSSVISRNGIGVEGRSRRREGSYVVGGKLNIDQEDRINNIARTGQLGVQARCASSRQLGRLESILVTSPFSRSDVFYSGSIVRLAEYEEAHQNIDEYRQRQSSISIPYARRIVTQASCEEPPPLAQISTVLDENDPEYSAGSILSCLPMSVREVMSEMFDLHLLKNPIMILLCLSNAACNCAFYVPYVYIVNRAELLNIDPASAAMLLSIMGSCNTIGRIFFGWFADRNWISALNIVNTAVLICGIASILSTTMETFTALAIYSAVFGFFLSTSVSLTSIYLVDYFGLDSLTNSFGLLILFRGICVMMGSPIGGAIYDATGSYNATFYFSGSFMILASFLGFLVTFGYGVRDRCTRFS